MVTRIATAAIQTASLDRMQQSNTKLARLTSQITSGLKADRFQQIATDSAQMLNLQGLRLNTDQYIENLGAADARLKASENALQGMSDLIVEAANLWTLGRNENSADVRANLAPKAENLTRTFYNLFQTKFEGRYVFSGMAGETPPITVAPTANTVPGPPPAPSTYYTGDPQKDIVITGAGTTQEFGITGDNDAFANMKAGLEALWYGLENNSVTDIDGAIDLLNQAQSDIGSTLGEVGGQLSGFDLLKTRHENSTLFLQERIDELEKVDIAEAITLFNQEQATLEASMLVSTSLNSLSLLDFLR